MEPDLVVCPHRLRKTSGIGAAASNQPCGWPLMNRIVVRCPDPGRWDLVRLSSTSNQEDISLSEQGLLEWENSLSETEPG